MPVERLDPQLGKNPEIEIEIGIEIEKAASAWIAPPETYPYPAKRYTYPYTMMRRVRGVADPSDPSDPSDPPDPSKSKSKSGFPRFPPTPIPITSVTLSPQRTPDLFPNGGEERCLQQQHDSALTIHSSQASGRIDTTRELVEDRNGPAPNPLFEASLPTAPHPRKWWQR
jgi:hypothetical protein